MKPIKLNYISFFSIKICLIRTHNCIWNNQTKKYDGLDIRCYCCRRRHCGGTPSRSATLFSPFGSRAHAIILFFLHVNVHFHAIACSNRRSHNRDLQKKPSIATSMLYVEWSFNSFLLYESGTATGTFILWITMSRELTCCSIFVSSIIYQLKLPFSFNYSGGKILVTKLRVLL